MSLVLEEFAAEGKKLIIAKGRARKEKTKYNLEKREETRKKGEGSRGTSVWSSN